MSEEPAVFTDEDHQEGRKYGELGPAYFASRRVCERAMAAFDADGVKPLIDKAAGAFRDALWDSVKDSLWSDTEMNLQGEMWRMVDTTVKALLTNERWAIDKYLINNSYDGPKIREAIAKHIPLELQAGRISDLEVEVKKLRDQLEWERRR